MSHVAAAHRLIATMTPDTIRAEHRRLAAISEAAALETAACPCPRTFAPLRAALDDVWPYTHAVGMLAQNGR